MRPVRSRWQEGEQGMRTITALAAATLALASSASAAGPPHNGRYKQPPPQQQQQGQKQPAPLQFEIRSLDGSGNNIRHPDWGEAGTQYLRVAPPSYADGISQPVSGPSARYISNRVFNDEGQNLFSENGSTQWVWTWGQFLDHTFGLRDETPAENMPIPFDKTDPLEEFTDDLGTIDFARTPAAPGTGTSTSNPRQQINTVQSFIDGYPIYGESNARLEWLRTGPVDGNMANNGAALLMTPDGYLPRATARGNAATAPAMDLFGAQQSEDSSVVVSGDVRANENIALTAVHTLLAREHNRIVGLLPSYLSNEQKFQIARRVVGAEEQYITYNEFLPSVGVHLPPYRGYDPNVNPGLDTEFATVGYRMHSMVHGDFDIDVPAGTYSPSLLATFAAEGIIVATGDNGDQEISVPLTLAFGNPDLLQQIGEGPLVGSLAANSQYKNDEQIDNSMRSVLFQIPKPGATQPCGTPVISPQCFTDVSDLGAIDVQRGRDHGIPLYNDLRKAYGLPPVHSFTEITGESTDQFPKGLTINTPGILDFTALYDINGRPIPLGSDASQEDAVVGIRRTTLAARLKAIYGDVNKVDAFVGMVSEKHAAGTEFGPLQLAIWTKQFEALRDGDRFFYANDPVLDQIRRAYGVDYRVTLAQLLELDAGVTVQGNAFRLPSLQARRSTFDSRLHGRPRPHPPMAYGRPWR
ncbi:MAG TPA: peroxidase family protein [Gaiellaceae bacterium]|nr:peroxidase family protein [Gaiellaceae bacterium]